MEKYDRGEIIDQDVGIPFPPDLVDKDVPQLKVQAGSKIRNLLDFALPAIKDIQQLVIVGSGPAVSKVITVTEILKRKQRGLDQWNWIGYKQVLEYWEPQEEGMSRLQVTREIPVMHVLLSKTPLDASLPGVQKAVLNETKHRGQQMSRRPKRVARASRMENERSAVGNVGSGDARIEQSSGFKEPKDRSKRCFDGGTESNRRTIPPSASTAVKNRNRGQYRAWNRRPSRGAADRDTRAEERVAASSDLEKGAGRSTSKIENNSRMETDETETGVKTRQDRERGATSTSN